MSPIEPIRQTNTNNVFSQFKRYEDFKIKNIKPKNNVLKELLLGTIVVGAGILCAYGIINKVKRGKTLKTNDLDIEKINSNPIIIDTKDKFKKLLSGLTFDDYDSQKTFRANLHIHSTASDGKLEPLEILKQANIYAQKLPEGERFSFALTDHDNIRGVRAICEEISKNPDKYKKINFVPGIELSCKYQNEKIADNPIELDFSIYGFNPENKKLLEEIQRRQTYLLSKTQAMFDEINQKYPKVSLSSDKMRKSSDNAHLRNICSNGYLKALRDYVINALRKSNIQFDEQIIDEAIIKNFNNRSFALDANMNILDAVRLSDEIDAFCSIAHPGKFNFGHAGLKTDGLVFSDDIITKYIQAGGEGIEGYYMSYKPQNTDWWNRIKSSFQKYNLSYLNTGGYDTHGLDIGSH